MNTVDKVVQQMFYVPKHCLDEFGNDIEDYRSILSIKYIEIQRRYLGFDEKFINDCFFVAAKHFKIDLHRKSIRKYFADKEVVSIENYLEARECVGILQDKLTQEEFYLLLLWVFKHYKDLEINSGFYYKAHKVAIKAKELLNDKAAANGCS